MSLESVGGREGKTISENSIDIYTLPCVEWIASGKVLFSTGSSARCSVIDLEGCGRGWNGSGAREGGDMYIYIYIYIYICRAVSLCFTAETNTPL